MADTLQAQYVDALENGWGHYVQRFQQLSPEAQAVVLKQQGYARLADLLAHVIGWWEEGLEAVRRMPSDPAFSPPDHNVDAFNALSVARYQQVEEGAVIQKFESLRRDWLSLLKSLPERELAKKRMADRLTIELIGHLEEHAF